ncbi:MAG: hypothetical protein LUF90_01070 [Rikenellaceae bacterium]|nr:hypothetical protein [Rikenellaceae bacterium]
MRPIHISDSRRRDAEVVFHVNYLKKSVKMVLPNGRTKENIKFIKSTIDIERSLKHYDDLRLLADDIMAGDPEIDMEMIGKMLNHTHKLYVDKNDDIAYRVNLFQRVINPDGTEKERRDINKVPSNVNSEIPLKWTGKRFKKDEAIRKFIFTRKYQIRHINGVTYDFLYNMAKELHDTDSLMLVGGGKKGTDPIMLSRGGAAYRGFLEGRVDGDRYCLILHLSNVEMKPLSFGKG